MNPTIAETQLLFVDLQPGFVASSRTNPPATLSSAASVLALAGELLRIPMTFLTVPDTSGPGTLIPELQLFATEANSFRRTTTSPFLKTEISHTISAHQRAVLVVSGFSAEVAVLQTALDGLEAGYEVIVPIDAIGSRSPRTEAAVLRQMEIAGAVVTSVRSLLMRLTPDVASSSGAEVLRLLRGFED